MLFPFLLIALIFNNQLENWQEILSQVLAVCLATMEGHQRAIMGNMTVEEIYKDRQTFSTRSIFSPIVSTIFSVIIPTIFSKIFNILYMVYMVYIYYPS